MSEVSLTQRLAAEAGQARSANAQASLKYITRAVLTRAYAPELREQFVAREREVTHAFHEMTAERNAISETTRGHVLGNKPHPNTHTSYTTRYEPSLITPETSDGLPLLVHPFKVEQPARNHVSLDAPDAQLFSATNRWLQSYGYDIRPTTEHPIDHNIGYDPNTFEYARHLDRDGSGDMKRLPLRTEDFENQDRFIEFTEEIHMLGAVALDDFEKPE